MRVLKWIFDRCLGRGHAVETELGLQPEYRDLEWDGLDFSVSRFEQVMRFDRNSWKRELDAHDHLFAQLGAKQPRALASAAATRLQFASGRRCGRPGACT
jgi:phosphoenolpyruvate carboxykinase (GTP)